MNLTFHGTFGLNFKEIRALIDVILKEPEADNFRISQLTGIGIGQKASKGKVKPTIDWAKFGGIIENKQNKVRHLELSEEGKFVYNVDPYLNSPITSWFFHYHLSKPAIIGEKNAWYYFIHKFLPDYYEFTRDDLIRGLQIEFPETKVDSINPGIILGSYLKESAMKSLSLIDEVKKGQYRKGISTIPNPFIFGYILAKIWEREHTHNITIPFDVLNDANHIIRTMNLSQEKALTYLDVLKNAGYIDLMRSVRPFQIVKQWKTSGEILKKAYEEI